MLTNGSAHRSLKIYAHNLQNYFSIDQRMFVFCGFSQLSGNIRVGKRSKLMKSLMKVDTCCILWLRDVRCVGKMPGTSQGRHGRAREVWDRRWHARGVEGKGEFGGASVWRENATLLVALTARSHKIDGDGWWAWALGLTRKGNAMGGSESDCRQPHWCPSPSTCPQPHPPPLPWVLQVAQQSRPLKSLHFRKRAQKDSHQNINSFLGVVK